jgi:hypothetical protein
MAEGTLHWLTRPLSYPIVADTGKQGIIIDGKSVRADKWLDSIGVRTASLELAHVSGGHHL